MRASFCSVFSYALLAGLYFVWPLPHTIALRFTLLTLGIAFFFFLLRRTPPRLAVARDRSHKILLGLVFSLTVWMLVNAGWISPEPEWAFQELLGQWGNALAAALFGVLAGSLIQRGRLRAAGVLLTLVLALAIHAAFLNLSAIYLWLVDGEPLRRAMGLTDGPDKSNYLTIAFLSLVLAEAYLRAFAHKRFLGLNTPTLLVLLGLGLAGFFLEEIRNGLAPLAVIFISLLFVYIASHRESLHPRRLASHALLALMFTTALVIFVVKTDARWQNTIDSARFAWQTQDNSAWLYDDKPRKQTTLPNGKPVEESSYLRTVMLKEGLAIVAEHPWGVGFGRNAFGHALKAKYGRGGGHSHSGLLDLAIGIGLPGLIMWVSVLAYAAYLGLRTFLRKRSYAGLALLLIVTTFSIRMIFDSIIRDHMLQQFMFTAALLATLSLNEADAT